jgi:hypothetical protein
MAAGRTRLPASDRAVVSASLARRQLLVLWLAAAAPLAWIPGGFTRFVFAKLLVTAVACAVGATIPPQGRLPRPIVATLAAGAGVLTLAALVGDTPVASLVGRWPRYEGLPVLLTYAAAAWLGARVVGRGPARMLHLAHALSGMAVVLFAFSLLDVAGHSPLGTSTLARSGSLLGNATDQGLVAMMSAAVIGALLLQHRDALLVSGLAGSLATVAFSGSRAALILTALALLTLAAVRQRRLLSVALGLLVAMLAVAFLVPATRDRLLSGATASGRVTQWRLTLDLVVDHPWLGIGPSRYVDAFGQYESVKFVRFTGPSTLADSPHQLFLQVADAGGLPLLVCFVVLLVLLIRHGWAAVREHPEAWGLAAATGGYGLALMINFTAAGPTCLAAFLAGALLTEQVPPAVATEPVWRRVAQPVVFGLAAVVFLTSSLSEVLLQEGVDAAAHGKRQVARSHIDSAHRWRPLDRDVAMLGSQAMAGLTDSGIGSAAMDTRALAEESLDRTPDAYQARVALGVALISEGDLEEARTDLDRAVRLFPRRPDAYIQRAVARYGLRDVKGALADLHIAQEINPRSAAVKRLLAAIEQG